MSTAETQRGSTGIATRLSALGAAAVLIAMAASCLVFNVFANQKIENEAIEAINSTANYTSTAKRVAQVMPLDESYKLYPMPDGWYTEQEEQLANWCAAHPQRETAMQATVDSWTCYVLTTDDPNIGWYYGYGELDGETPHGPAAVQSGGQAHERTSSTLYVLYTDVTDERELVLTVNVAFAIIAVVGAIAAAVAGRAAGRRIEEAQRAQTRFYENMSHELKTPLAAIRGYAEGLAAGVVEPAKATNVIVEETERMRGQIDAILGLSRLEGGAVKLDRREVEIADFVQDCLMPFEGIVRTRGISVDLDLAAGSASMDPEQFDHALSNVFANALRHAATRLVVRYDGQALSVWNDGETPDADQVRHLFDRFYTNADGGTGIGLALAREIVELHGWHVDAELSEEGRRTGLRVIFRLS